MAVMRMSRLASTSLREAPQYSQASSEALLARFFQLCQLLSLLAITASIFLGIFLNVSWLWITPAVLLRSLPIFVCLVLVTLYRKVNVHLNYLPYPSIFAEYWARFLTKKFLITIAVYSLSSFLFFFSYKFQMSDIAVTTPNKNAYSLPKLNERYLYINLYAFVLALVAAILHIAFDVDRLVFTFENATLSAQTRIVSQLSDLAKQALVVSGSFTLVCPLIYLILRSRIWGICLPIARRFFSLHHTTIYSGFPVSFGMLLHTFLASAMLCFGWLFANLAFSVYMTLGPSHRGELISSKSLDKNGTLVTGLQSKKKQLIRMLAFQELAYIAFNKRDRRISIFADIDRKTTIWTQIKVECLSLLDEILVPLQKKKKENKQNATTPKENKEEPNSSPASLIHLKDTNVFVNKKQPANIMDGFQDKNAQASKEVIGIVEQIKSQTKSHVQNYSVHLKSFLESDFGSPLRFTIERRVQLLIPNPILTSTGVLALATLVCKSLDKDQYGTVQKDISEILQKLSQTSAALNAFIEKPPVHWSNSQEMSQKDHFKGLENARNVLEAVDSSFDQIITGFYEYLPSLNLSKEVIEMINQRILD